MGLSGMHLFLLLILVVVVFGPSRLPKIGRSFGDAVRGFKKGLHGDEIDVTDSIRREPFRESQRDASQPPPGPANNSKLDEARPQTTYPNQSSGAEGARRAAERSRPKS